MAEVNLRSWPEISQASEGLQLNSTAATLEYIRAWLDRLETRLVEHERRAAATLPPLRPEPDPPDGPPLYAAQQPHYSDSAPPMPYSATEYHGHNLGYQHPHVQNQHAHDDAHIARQSVGFQQPHSVDPYFYGQPPDPYFRPDEYQPDYLKAYQPYTQSPHVDRPPYAWQQPTSYDHHQYNLHLPAQPDLSSNTWQQAYLGSCWLPSPPTHVETHAHGFVEIQHSSHQPQHSQFQISAEPISDSSDVEMPIKDVVLTEELPPIDVIEKEDGSIAEGFDYSTEKILDYSVRSCGLEKVEKKIRHEYERKKTKIKMCKEVEYSKQLDASRKVLQAWVEFINSLRANTVKDLLTDSWHVSEVARVSHCSMTLAADARLILRRTFLGIHGRVAFDPGGNTSPKLLFASLFVVSWFPP